MEAGPAKWLGHRRGDPGYKRIVAGLFGAGIATFAQLYCVQAILPTLSSRFHVTAATAALTVSLATAGVAVSVVPWASVADRIGRARSMSISIVVASVLGLILPFAPNLTVMLCLRFAVGLMLGALPALAVAYIAEEVAKPHRALAAATYISGTTIGGIAGRLLPGPFVDTFGWQVGLGAVAVLCSGAAAVFLCVSPRPRGFVSVAQRRARNVSPPELSVVLKLHLTNRPLLAIYVQAFLLMGSFVAVYNYLGYRLELPPFVIPVALSSLIFLAYLSGTISSRLAAHLIVRWGRQPVLLTSIAVMIFGILVTLPPWLPTIIVGLILITAGFFAEHSLATSYTAVLAPTGTGHASALYTLFYYGGSSIVGWAIGLVFSTGGWAAASATECALCVIALLVARRSVRPSHPQEVETLNDAVEAQPGPQH